jgi:ferredoxin
MKVSVDRSVCQSHGQCVMAAPEVFDLDDGLNLNYDATPADELRGAVREAALMCPTQAITVESDP